MLYLICNVRCSAGILFATGDAFFVFSVFGCFGEGVRENTLSLSLSRERERRNTLSLSFFLLLTETAKHAGHKQSATSCKNCKKCSGRPFGLMIEVCYVCITSPVIFVP